MSNNQVVYQSHLHWIVFLWPVVLMIAAVYVGLNFAAINKIALFFAFIALAWFLMVWMTYQFSSLTIKRKQVILRTGFFVRETTDIPLNKIESIDIRQTLLGSIFKYGSLVITGTGGTKQLIHYLNRPLTCRRYIEQLMHS